MTMMHLKKFFILECIDKNEDLRKGIIGFRWSKEFHLKLGIMS